MKQNIYDNPEFFRMYTDLRKTRITYNDFVEQPAIKALLPELKGLHVLDLGCGCGELSFYCIEKGADKVTGVDISERMLSVARPHAGIKYIRSAMEDLVFQRESFDLVISSLAINYVKEYAALAENVFQWLRPDCYFIFSTEHPIITSGKSMTGWIKDKDKNKLFWPVDDYHEEGERSQFWGVNGVIKYHRTISTLLNSLISAGFKIEKIVEPQSTKEGLEKMPKLINEKRRPSFLLIKARK